MALSAPKRKRKTGPGAPGPRKNGVRRRRKRARRREPRANRLWRYAAEAGFYVFAAAIATAAVLLHFVRDLPSTDGLWRTAAGPRVTLIAADGSPIAVHGQSLGAPVRLADLPRYAPQAVLAVEDRNFYHHVGVNPLSVARAFVVNAREGQVRQGGSTLTQQLAKNLFLSSDRTMRRKGQELLLALWLEHRFTKDEILTLYLNRVYFGAGAYGLEAASRRYFGKPASALTLAECAMLAGLLKAPSHFAPDKNPHDAGARARLVLNAMVEAGFISDDDAARASRTAIRIGPSQFAGAPYFIDFAITEARRRSRGIDADLVVRTTLDRALNQAADLGLIAGAARAGLDPAIEAAVVILDGEGRIKAMAGGRDYRASQFNRAADARRQPGSAFKPFVFLAALELGADPNALVDDAPVSVGAWSPANYKDQYFGSVTLTEALARSLNGATVRVQEQTGRGAVRLAARRMGVASPLSAGPALALGVDAMTPLELAGAYAPLVNGGYRIEPHGVEAVATPDGEIVYRRESSYQGVAASPRAIAALNDMLRAVVVSGTGRAAALSRFDARGKTGTTQDNRDAWFAGHAGGLICVVWVGRDDNKPMGDVTGGAAPAAIWREVMERALSARAPKTLHPFAAPILAAESAPG
ncbi:MAG: transglycosylase domain-containing protein [Parvularculaceae bacterium]